MVCVYFDVNIEECFESCKGCTRCILNVLFCVSMPGPTLAFFQVGCKVGSATQVVHGHDFFYKQSGIKETN